MRACPVPLFLLLTLLTASLGAQVASGVFETHYTIDGGAAGDGLGESVAGAGDVNQDGYPDVIVGSNQADPGGRDRAGSAFVYSGEDGTLIWRFDGAAELDLLGNSVAGLGDVNQDGFPDVIVGAPLADPGGKNEAGCAFIYSGKDGTLIWRFDGEEGGRLGISVAPAGDVNRDGYPDAIVGAPETLTGGPGSAFVYSGKDGTVIWRFDGGGNILGLGITVDGAGDVNRDGFPDVIVGANSSNPRGMTEAGSAFVYSGKDGTVIWQLDGAAPFDRLGRAVAGAGDVNQDGFSDVIVGAALASPGLLQLVAGSAFVYSGKDGTVIWRFDGGAPFDQLGSSVAGAGDVNRDGFADVIVAAPEASPDGRDAAGSAYVYSGKDGSLLWQFNGRANGDNLGNSVAQAEDVNQDGFPDLILGAVGAELGGESHAGSALVFVYEPAFLWYGSGPPGTGNVVPRIGTGGEIPQIGSATFKIELTEAVGNSPCAIAGSIERLELSVFGGTVYGDFLTPGAFAYWILTTSGPTGFPGVGTATLSIPIPNDSALVGFTTYWQGFVLDSGSPLAIGLTHTGGLAVTVVW